MNLPEPIPMDLAADALAAQLPTLPVTASTVSAASSSSAAPAATVSALPTPSALEAASPRGGTDALTAATTARPTATPSTAAVNAVTTTTAGGADGVVPSDVPAPPWWMYVIFGVLVLSTMLNFYLLTNTSTSCPKVASSLEEGAAASHERANASLATHSVFACHWNEHGAPPPEMELSFLLATAPHTTHSCRAATLFAHHRRVKLTLPRGEYLVRATFADGTQSVTSRTFEGNYTAELTHSTLECTPALPADLQAPDVPNGSCLHHEAGAA